MEIIFLFILFFTAASLYFISYWVPKQTIEEGFQGGESDELVQGATDESSGIVKYLDSNELYDDFYASVYDQLTQNSIRTQAEVGLMLHEWTKRGEEYKTFDVLDVGCGTGIASVALAKVGVKKITGLDASDAMLKQAETVTQAQSTLTSEQSKHLEWRKGNAIDPSVVAPAEFTHAFLMYFTLYYFADKEALFRNLYLWIKPGGRLCISVVNKHKFDPMLESSAPFVAFSLQKYSKQRVTKSEVVFNRFTYSGDFDLQDPLAEFRETFRFKSGKIRRQKHSLKMEDMNQIVGYAKLAGWNYSGFVDLTPVGFEYAYHLHFRK
jgi:ubiquinone/menaquinone biosynthesis C-methylase UbiE